MVLQMGVVTQQAGAAQFGRVHTMARVFDLIAGRSQKTRI
jgi:hypothetical protein